MNMAADFMGRGSWRKNRWCAALLLAGALGCSGLADNAPLPPDVRDPAEVKTAAGAMAAYRAALVFFRRAMDGGIGSGALLSDEATQLAQPLGQTSGTMALDSRYLPEGGYEASLFTDLHAVRAQTREARGFLGSYAPDSSVALTGHLYAIEGYMEIMLADLFCSGIPLSTLDYEGDFTLMPGSPTTDVYRHALALLDTALMTTTDSVRFHHLAAVGSGRARLGIGDYAGASDAVAAVPDDYAYGFLYDPSKTGTAFDRFGLWASAVRGGSVSNPTQTGVTMSDIEGLNGLDYRSSGDPRTAFEARWQNMYGSTMYLPLKYTLARPVTLVIASGIEARLIQAEAALHAGGSEWLTMLNALRTDGAFDTQPNAGDPEAVDTLWHAGSGNVAGLRPLVDPGTFDARVDLLFRERAFWLYYTGIRLGDMRRLIREYFRLPESVFPTGSGYLGNTGMYGPDVNMPTPQAEKLGNPKYTGCIHRNA